MRKKIFYITSCIILFLIISTSKAYASTPISPIDNVYKEGVYQLDESYKGSYDLKFQFLNSSKNSTIIILDENADITYKNINCNRKCNAGTITSKNTIIVITDGEIELIFTRISQ